MSIWTYKDCRSDPDALSEMLPSGWNDQCLFCSERLKQLSSGSSMGRMIIGHNTSFTKATDEIWICGCCGWWGATGVRYSQGTPYQKMVWVGAVGSLLSLDLSDQHFPLHEIRKYLCAQYEKRFVVDSKLFEQVVASVYSDLGFKAEAVGASGDGGIDVVLTDSSGKRIGVQVKRYQNTIQVEQIRALTGALVIKGLTAGIFVTTSSFTAGGEGTAKASRAKGYPVELVDHRRFFDALKIAQRNCYEKSDEPDAPWKDVPMVGYLSLGFGQ